MKFKIEKNIKIINELIAYFYKFGTTDVLRILTLIFMVK